MAERVIAPSKWRQRHGTVVRAEATVKDAEGGIGLPWRAYDTLERMLARGTITRSMLDAGQRFHDAFRRAGLDGLRGADPRRIPVVLSAGNRFWDVGNGTSNEGARLVIETSLDALGGINGPGGSCAWYVLGCEMHLRDWAQIYRWGQVRQLDVRVASGILILDLSLLELHYGLKKP